MNHQSVKKNTSKRIKFKPDIPTAPIIVKILCFYIIPGRIAKEISTPPSKPPA